MPSSKAQSSIYLPDHVEDPEGSDSNDSNGYDEAKYDNIYVADVVKDLSLRKEPDVNAELIVSLAPLTHMQVMDTIPGNKATFAYVEVLNGNYTGMTGYVNFDYITKLGESLQRVDTQ